MRTEELHGAVLDHYTGLAFGVKVQPLLLATMNRRPVVANANGTFTIYSPSTCAEQCFALIDKFNISLLYLINDYKNPHHAHMHVAGRGYKASAGQRKEAVCRAVVLWRYGPEVPDLIDYK